MVMRGARVDALVSIHVDKLLPFSSPGPYVDESLSIEHLGRKGGFTTAQVVPVDLRQDTPEQAI